MSRKKRSPKFWLAFWTLSVVFLAAWFGFWEYKNQGAGTILPVLDAIPFLQGQGEDYKSAAKIAQVLLKKDGKERTFLILFQNNLEIRPGGGFIGAFGVLKVRDGEVVSIETHDLSNFDGRIPEGIEPPYPMKETLGIKSWKLRDSNYSPDFETNAKKAEEFYYMGQGGEKFDGIIGITTNVFSSILKVVGPIHLKDYPGTYDSENAVITLEYQVEKAFEEQGIARGDRKSVMTELAEEIKSKIASLDMGGKIELGKAIINDLNRKEIQLYFKDPELQGTVSEAGWSGKIDENWDKDYLMLVDANLGAFKSDYYVQRSVEYMIDLSKNKPVANLKIRYVHTAKQKDWMTRDYLTYLRVYVPKDAWLIESDLGDVRFGDENNRKYFGSIVKVPIGSERTVSFSYALPEDFSNEYYDLLIQKQSGILDIPYRVTIIGKDGRKTEKEFRINSDTTISEIGE